MPSIPAARADVPGPNAHQARRHVVVGVDGSPGSRIALGVALRAAAARTTVLDVVAAVPVRVEWTGLYPVDITPGDLAQAVGDHVREFTEEVRAELGAGGVQEVAGVEVRLHVREGRAAPVLLDAARDADLLVVGSRGRGAVRSALLGSVALHCVNQAGCPVLVVPPAAAAVPTGPPGAAPVVVGVDGSPASRSALTAAVEEALRTGADLEVVSTFLLADAWIDLPPAGEPLPDQVAGQLTRTTEQLVDRVLRARAAAGDPRRPRSRTVVEEGAAADVLVQRARAAALLVVGNRGRGTFRGMLLGSVALQSVMHAPCPVLVVRPLPAGRRPASPGELASAAPAGGMAERSLP